MPSYGSVPPPPDPPGGPGGPVPPPPPPPAPPSYSAQGFSAPEAIAWGWRKFTENVGAVILAMLAILAISLVLGFVGNMLGGGFTANGTPGQFQLESAGVGELLAQLLQSVVSIVLGGVAAKAALEVTEGKPFDFFGAFGRVNLVQLVLAALIVGIATLIGFILLIVPGLIVMFLTYLTTYAVVDADRSAIEGIKHSVRLTTQNVGPALMLGALNVLVVIAGVIALCVGLIVALPVTIFATAYAYRAFNGQPVAP